MGIHVVLVEPEIPQNTGNIARTCAAIHAKLHLVKPLGFSLESKYLKRAGLDYWNLLDIEYHDSLQEFFQKYSNEDFYYASTKGGNYYTQMNYKDECFILFGKETAGLPKDLLAKNLDRVIRIPMVEDARSLNLSNSVAIIVYEAMRQLNFVGLI
ncbi:tRNA (uridine(34)/cytosine(34)/5-carboxymethylaminomethyluridine(34)-2'-O)-methyltransferase TrmL [Garciella nitratireducens]|uniref:tRNA (uridine(34)/cytosine(34)/5- carboxymethylaminomethyluridine(34)-2'-O)- methyltransferase TrmL n=1 Tax=Garciella nitratireducens TaxID=218205 RepID=UPI000DE9B345|nr:tRNA (uridine(34)/cytosine(34)/5-carboxymethylaminomethyluridine(34)-2'-O)-methyltransferase TrmL [Garciella nitratireducens]RBP41601.1 tRNA (cytidine/uridine-2'-O-)-methyltransferase [Garciella nitratireducens]